MEGEDLVSPGEQRFGELTELCERMLLVGGDERAECPVGFSGRLTLGAVHRRLVATEAQHSVAVIGPAGTGKTTGFAIPALLEWDGPSSPPPSKGDLLENTTAHRCTVGETFVFDPVGSTAEPSAGWSPLNTSDDWQGALRMAAWLASTARASEGGDRGSVELLTVSVEQPYHRQKLPYAPIRDPTLVAVK